MMTFMEGARALPGLLVCGLALCCAQGVAQAAPPASPDAAAYRKIAAATEANLRQQDLGKWFPAAVDPAGGFQQDFREDWSPGTANGPVSGQKSIVYQARLTWVAAQAAMHYPAQASAYKADTRHGLAFLANGMWDKQDGGFFWSLDGRGQPERGGEKHTYGISFAIYAASAAYQATHDPAALRLALRAYRWLDAHAHDGRHLGYYEALSRDGTPLLARPTSPGAPAADAIGTPYGEKSMNTHIHLLEAFTALYEVWPDPGLRARLQEMFLLVRDRVAGPKGYLTMFFTPDWHPVPGHDSFGHDVETAYLLTEAAATLGHPEDAHTWAVARHLVDHALQYGWDGEHGGFYDSGQPDGAPLITDKFWWEEAEGLNALLLMHARYGHTTPRYWEAFTQQWDFIQKHQIDPVHGGWYPNVTRAGAPTPGQPKSDGWTEAYHQGRALFNVTARLRHLAAGEKRA